MKNIKATWSPRGIMDDAPPAPRVVDAEAFGGIRLVNIYPPPGTGTTVSVEDLSLLGGDEVRLFWSRTKDDSARPIDIITIPGSFNGPLLFHVLPDILRTYPAFPNPPYDPANHRVLVWYTIRRPFPEQQFTSLVTSVTVDWLVPGDPDPDPTTPYVNENLPPLAVPDPVPTGKDLVLRIPRWRYTASGDQLNVAWGNSVVSTMVADVLGESGPPIDVTIPWSTIREQGEGIAATYFILDTVSNHSLWAPAVHPDIEGGDRLPAPRVDELDDDGTLDLGKLGRANVTLLPVNNGGFKGTMIAFTWMGTYENGTAAPPYRPDPKTLRYDGDLPSFSVPNAQAAALAGGKASVTYTRTDPDGGIKYSQRRDVTIVGAPNLKLPRPSLREADNDTIRADLALAHVDIPEQARGTSVTVDIPAAVPFHQTQTMNDPGHPPVFDLPGTTFIAPNAGATVLATYTVAGPGYSAVSEPYAFSILPGVPALAAPTVGEAVGNQIDPAKAAVGITVVIAADSSITANDSVTVTVDGAGGSVTTAPAAGSPTGLTVAVGADVIGKNLGQSITVGYTVAPPNQTPRQSPLATFLVQDLPSFDPRVAPPALAEAGGTFTLDLNAFTGDATVDVARWPLMATGQRFWLTAESGVSRQPIATSETVALPGALQRRLSRTWLDTFADGATLVVHLDIAFDGSTQQGNARRFTSPSYTLKAKSAQPTFPAPNIPEATAGQLDGARTSATLRVPGSALLVGDSVSATFGTYPLGTQVVTIAGNDLTFSITQAMIVAKRGKNVVSAYTVTRSGTATPSATLSVLVTVPASPWDATFDFDQEATRSESSKSGRQLRFDGVFHFMFDRDNLPVKEQFIGVKPLLGAPVDDYFKNQVLWIGHPSDDTLIEKRVLCELYETWSRVRFAISVMDDPVTVTFQDEQRRVIGNVQTLTPPASKYVSVEGNAVDARKIKWIEIRCPDTIHLDFFKFKQ